MIDLNHSRVRAYHKCIYWVRDTNNKEKIDNFVVNNKEQGIFYARPTTYFTQRYGDIADTYLVSRETISIKTFDDVKELKVNDIVKYDDGKVYRVYQIDRLEMVKESMFGGKHYETFIEMVR